MAKAPHIAFSFIGGQHQFLHGAPVVAALSKHAGVTVEAFVLDAADAAALRDLLDQLGASDVPITTMVLPAPLEALLRRLQGDTSAKFKVPRLIWWSGRMRSADLIVTLERTSTVLKRLPGHCPPMAHIPHGAGDGAKGYDQRIRYFDYVLVGGEKDRKRMIAFGLAKPERVSVAGYIKLAGLKRIRGAQRPRLFDNDRPTVLYNAHWNVKLNSWAGYSENVIAQFAASRRFNLIVAPHVRLFEKASSQVRAQLEALSDPDWLLVDTGSERSIDMTYTLAADIYLGDISSQVYEFCTRPRPCIFINATGVEWQDDPHFSMWHLGEVIHDAAELMPAIDAALADPDQKREQQIKAVRYSLGDPEDDAAERAAGQLLAILGT